MCAAQLHLDSYQAFMEHMCPGTALAGQVPPPGTDPAACPKPIMGRVRRSRLRLEQRQPQARRAANFAYICAREAAGANEPPHVQQL